MTLHSSKGLEFPVVFIVGMENGNFPGNKCFDDINEMEESRRLCYVGITRAKELLYFTYASVRMVYGETTFRTKSKFLMEISKDLILDINFNGDNRSSFKNNSTASFEKFPYDRGFGKSSDEFKNDISKDEARIGRKVNHKTFGVGTVVKVEESDGDAKLYVAFDRNGVKKLLLSKAPIEFI